MRAHSMIGGYVTVLSVLCFEKQLEGEGSVTHSWIAFSALSG